MAKSKWETLQAAFLADHAATGVTVKDWCEQKGLNYQTARRHIKLAAEPVRTMSDEPGPPGRHQDGGFAEGNEVGKDTRFQPGNKLGGNPNPPNAFQPGNQAARKHGAYAKYFPVEILAEVAASQGLPDELMLTRARIHALLRSLDGIQSDLEQADDPDTRADLYKSMLSAEQNLSRYIQQVESIERTLIGNDYQQVSSEHKRQDIERVREQAAALRAGREKLERETGSTQTPLSDAVRDIQQANSGLLHAPS